MNRKQLIEHYTTKLENTDLTQLSRHIAESTLEELEASENAHQLLAKMLKI